MPIRYRTIAWLAVGSRLAGVAVLSHAASRLPHARRGGSRLLRAGSGSAGACHPPRARDGGDPDRPGDGGSLTSSAGRASLQGLLAWNRHALLDLEPVRTAAREPVAALPAGRRDRAGRPGGGHCLRQVLQAGTGAVLCVGRGALPVRIGRHRGARGRAVLDLAGAAAHLPRVRARSLADTRRVGVLAPTATRCRSGSRR